MDWISHDHHTLQPNKSSGAGINGSIARSGPFIFGFGHVDQNAQHVTKVESQLAPPWKK